MSVTVELYEYSSDMDDDVLSSLGVKGGLLGQLSVDADIDDEMDLLRNAPSHTVGRSTEAFPSRVLDEVNGLQTVDSIFIQTMETAVDELADEADAHEPTLDWLRSREGEQVFVKGL